MTDQETLDALLDAGLVRRVDGDLQLGDQVGLLDPAKVEALGRLITKHLPPGTSALVIGDTRLDALLGFVVGRALGLRVVLMYDYEGIGEMHGEMPRGAQACLLTGLLQDSWRIDEFYGLCRQQGGNPVGALALVSSATFRDERLTSLLEL